MGNPFTDLCDDLYVIDTKDVVDAKVVETLYQLENLGRQSYDEFVQDRLVTRITSLFAPIKRNRLPLFSKPPTKTRSNKLQISSLKSDCSLFSRLDIGCQARDGNLDDFFQHENQSTPPSLSKLGKLRTGNKSDLLLCLEKYNQQQNTAEPVNPNVDVMLIDGASIVHMLRARNS